MYRASWMATPKTLPVVRVEDFTSGPMECCAVTVRLGSWDTTVASFYVRPNKPWNASSLLPLTARLGRDFLLCGDLNGHHTAWGGHRCCARAIDISLATERCAYAWSICPDTWGSDHFPIFLATNTGPAPRTRVCCTVNWDIFRRLSAAPAEGDFLKHIVNSAQAATLVSRTQPGRPVPDLKQLQLWVTRRRAEHRAIRSSGAEDWTAFRRLDAVCRRHANRRWKESWESVCSSISSSRRSSTAWRLLRSLQRGPTIRQPILAVAISSGLTELALADLLANQFAARPPGPPMAARPSDGSVCMPRIHHHAFTLERVAALCNEPFQFHELTASLDRSKRRSTPGADGITFQMLRNLADSEKAQLLNYFKDVWNSGQLPATWLTAIIVPMLKARKPGSAPSSYRPVSLTSAACKVMETMVLARLEWIARALDYFPEQQTGFRRHRCTADSLGDVVSALEHARSRKEAALLVLLDVQSAFDGLPHLAVEQALATLGVGGRMLCFVQGFLSGRFFRVRVGRALSSPHPVTSGIEERSSLKLWDMRLIYGLA
ncbi:hypothetical protein HPB52_024849 [Rhipicephalus sanguineus]|uniref:Reverse transcriptase domain-containing protein n=1 Tax=Rhipicephalus sanguineus TaxID=34632 RepID=A0A9D4TEB0_RHISA|nr:hypothetical protein HPB52_024849 [Rhipicephalus sanguineus]